MNVISIQSQVAYGHVGNSAAVFPMQMHGIDVVAVPTTLLSNRPGYPTIRGRVLDAELVADLLRGIEERGAVDTAHDDPVGLSRLGRQSPPWSRISSRAPRPKIPRCCIAATPCSGIATAACSSTPTSRRWCATCCARLPISSRPIISSSNG